MTQEPRRCVPRCLEYVHDPSKVIRVQFAKLANPERRSLPPSPRSIAVEFSGEGLDSMRASREKVHVSREVCDAPTKWDLAALGNHVGNIPRGGLEVCEHLSVERGSRASWLVEDQFAHRRRFHHGRTW